MERGVVCGEVWCVERCGVWRERCGLCGEVWCVCGESCGVWRGVVLCGVVFVERCGMCVVWCGEEI